LEFQYFADLACGNGLLTYLLNAEGIRGCGIDARSRGIWDKFREDGAELHKTSINPSDTSCTAIPECTDFLIGNHSDELTPWIPVMAAR
jgi:tRNASer (uridine44-2'-O)-methyltransferase